MTPADPNYGDQSDARESVALAPHVKQMGLVLVIASLIAIGLATLLPQPPARTGSHLCLTCGSLGVVNAILNVFLFVPLGIGLGMYRTRWKQAVLFAGMLSTAIELTQWLAIPGRYSTVGDVITNTLGAVIGFAIARNARQLISPNPVTARMLGAAWAAVWLGVQLVSNYGFMPVVPRSQYYGQLARSLGSFEVFRGSVIDARIASEPIPNSAIANGPELRRLVLRGDPWETRVVPAAPTRGVAPIVRIADGKRREIGILAQDDVDFVFGVRTGASALKLHNPQFVLPSVFPDKNDPAAPAAMTLAGVYRGRGAILRAVRGATQSEAHLPIRASLAWTFWLPFQWFIEGTSWESAIGVVWSLLLILPLGYWATMAVRRSRAFITPVVQALVAVGAAVLVGLVLIPAIFAVPPGSLIDWLATTAGLATGASATRLALAPDRSLAIALSLDGADTLH